MINSVAAKNGMLTERGDKTMDGNTIPISEKTTVIVKSSGDLFLEGKEQSEVRFQSSEDRIRVNQSNDTLYVETHASMDLTVPHNAHVIIEKVGGSALIQDLRGPLVVQKVGGDLGLQRMGDVRIEKVGGSCMINEVSGMLSVQKVGGDLTIRAAAGKVEIVNVGGTGDFQLVVADALEARAGGDIRLYVTEGLNGRVSLRAGGSVQAYLQSNVRGSFILMSGGESISIDLSRQAEPIKEHIEARRYEFSQGESSALLEAQAGGDVRLSDEPVEPHSIADDLARREEAWKEARERHGSPSWSGGFGFDRTSAWADMISRRAQEAARRAEQRASSAMRRTEEQIRRAAERDVNWGIPGAPPPPPSPKPAQRVTEQERLMVLQMLQEKKITVEQAEKLLAALEGRFEE
jgi:hypothetical protein